MRLGLIARCDNSGLGIQTLEFYRHMTPTKTMVVDISKLNGNRQYPERYPDGIFIKGFPTASDIDDFLKDLDVVFIAESAYNPYLFTRARELGVKTAVQHNYEFFDWFQSDMPKPDMFISPSKWHYQDVQKLCDEDHIKHVYLHCPVNRDLLPQRTIKQARTFLHVAGKSAAHDRNGTDTVIRASRYLQTDAQILIHFQGEQGLPHQSTSTIADYVLLQSKKGDEEKVTIEQIDFENYQDVYGQGDVLLLPRRYGGNCLPMNEALSVGMPVIMTDIEPNRGFLPSRWLVPAHTVGQFTPRTIVDIYGSKAQDLAAKIDEFYKLSVYQMGNEQMFANSLAKSISWDTMRPQYREVLEQLCTP